MTVQQQHRRSEPPATDPQFRLGPGRSH